jgi:DNA transformation protein and related proteins
MKKDSFRDFVLEQLHDLRGVHIDRMFGGFGIYCTSRFFGIIHGGRLFFRVNDASRPLYAEARSGPFRYGSGKIMKDFLEVPVDVLENAERLVEWAEQSVVAAQEVSPGRPKKIRFR